MNAVANIKSEPFIVTWSMVVTATLAEEAALYCNNDYFCDSLCEVFEVTDSQGQTTRVCMTEYLSTVGNEAQTQAKDSPKQPYTVTWRMPVNAFSAVDAALCCYENYFQQSGWEPFTVLSEQGHTTQLNIADHI